MFPTVRMSTRVLLATLSIPATPERTDIARLLEMDDVIVEKHRRLATLLDLQSPPTRQSLINDMVRGSPLRHYGRTLNTYYGLNFNLFVVDTGEVRSAAVRPTRGQGAVQLAGDGLPPAEAEWKSHQGGQPKA